MASGIPPPVGSDWTPPPVRAVDVLQRLFEPWREMAEDEDVQASLIVSFGSGQGMPTAASSVRKIITEKLLQGQKTFLRQWVDLSGLRSRNARGEDLARYRDSQGTCITTHQWRKTYALYLFRVSNRLLPAISQQFKHLSLAMTERAYIGNDIALLRDIDAAHVQHTVNFWAQLAPDQKVRLAGRMGSLVEKKRPEIAKIVAGLEGEMAIEALKSWVLRHDLRILPPCRWQVPTQAESQSGAMPRGCGHVALGQQDAELRGPRHQHLPGLRRLRHRRRAQGILGPAVRPEPGRVVGGAGRRGHRGLSRGEETGGPGEGRAAHAGRLYP